MLPSLSGLSLNDEEPTGAIDTVVSEIGKQRQKAREKKALRKLREDWEQAERDEAPYLNARARERNEAAARRAAEEERDKAVAARDREAAARRAAEQERDQAQQNAQALDGVRGLQQNVIDAQQRNLNKQSEVLEEAKKAQGVLVTRVIDAEARQAYFEEEARRTPSPQRTPVHDDDAAPRPDLQLPGQYDSQGTDDGDAPMEAEEDEYPPLRGDRSLLQPSTYNGIEELRQHLEFDSEPKPTGASPNLEDVLRIGFEQFMDYPSVKRGTQGRAEMSPAALEKSMLADRRKAWKEFTAARDIVLNDEAEVRRWLRLRVPSRASKIPLEKVRWKTEQYLMHDILDFADHKKGGEGVALKYFKNAQTYPAIQKELYKALQERQRSDGRTIFVRTEKVQAVYEAALAFCQADLKYELTLARRRTWAALYQFLEASMLELPRDSEGNLQAREVLWEHAIDQARKKLHCFPPDANTFERLQLLMEKQVTNNIRWQYPYYNAYELSRDDGIFGKEFKFWISKGPTVSLVVERGASIDERSYYIQHVHIPWEWMKTFLKSTATDLARGLGDFCGSRFLVDKEYEAAKEDHDSKKPDAPKALQTLPDPRITKVAPLTLKEHRRLQSDLSDRGFDEASRGAQIMLGTMHSNYHTTSVEPMSIARNRRYGSMVPEDYEFYDPYLEAKEETWEPVPGWEPSDSWRPDIRTNRRRAFLRMHKKYWEYAKQQEYAQTFIAAFEESEKALYLQAWKERELVGELFDPNECLRKTPKRTAFALSLTSGFNVAPHDDSGAALEHIVFTYPAHTELPLGHNPMFVASGVIMVLPGPVDKGPPGDELAGIRACLCTVPGHDVHHGSMPTWTASYYKMMLEGGKLDELTLPKHFKCGSALITKVVPQMLAQRKDKETGDWIEFEDCKGLIDELNPRYMNDKNMNVPKLMQLLYEGNKPYRNDEDPHMNDPPGTNGKVWSFDVRTQWLASYPNANDRKQMKSLMVLAYKNVYGLTQKQQEELKEQQKQQEEEAARRPPLFRAESNDSNYADGGAEVDEEQGEEGEGEGEGEEDDDSDGGGGGGGDDDDDGDDDGGGGGGGGGSGAPEPEPEEEVDAYAAMASDDDGGGGNAPESEEVEEQGGEDFMEDDESSDADDSLPLNQRPITPTPPAQAGPSAAPMDVEGDGATTPPSRGSDRSAQMPPPAPRRHGFAQPFVRRDASILSHEGSISDSSDGEEDVRQEGDMDFKPGERRSTRPRKEQQPWSSDPNQKPASEKEKRRYYKGRAEDMNVDEPSHMDSPHNDSYE